MWSSRSSARPTDLVFPVDASESDPVAEAEAAATELDWSFHDAELTQQLKAAHRGRGTIVALIASSLLAVATGIALVL
jgi:hypothetical protein